MCNVLHLTVRRCVHSADTRVLTCRASCSPTRSSSVSSKNPSKASGDRLHLPGSRKNSSVTEPETSYLEGYYWMPKREQQHASSSSGRNESHNPNVQASGDWLQSNEHDDTTNIVSRSQVSSKFGDVGGRKPQENFRKIEFDEFPSQHCNVVYLRTGLHVGISPHEQISRDLHQNYSFSNTQETLKILTGSTLENEQDGEPVVLHDEENTFRRMPDRG